MGIDLIEREGYRYKLNNINNGLNIKYMNDNTCVLTQPKLSIEDFTVTSFSRMFANRNRLNIVDMSDWDLSKIKSTMHMFSRCISLEVVDFGEGFSALEKSEYMFAHCTKLTKVKNLKNTKYHESSYKMFTGCKAIKTIDLTNFKLGVNVSSMFKDCISLENVALYKSNSDTKIYVTATLDKLPFVNCNNLKEINLNSVKFVSPTIVEIFKDVNSLEVLQSDFITNEEALKLLKLNTSIKEIIGRDFLLKNKS